MLREASTIAIAPSPVPVPYETVPSYATGQTTILELSNEEYCSSSIPPKFIGSEADSDILILDFRSCVLDRRNLSNRQSKIKTKITTVRRWSCPCRRN